MNREQSDDKSASPHCTAGVSKKSQILTVRRLSIHVNNLTLFLNYFVGTDGFQMHDFLL